MNEAIFLLSFFALSIFGYYLVSKLGMPKKREREAAFPPRKATSCAFGVGSRTSERQDWLPPKN